MNTKTIKGIIFIALLVHGIGHIQGVICVFGVQFKESSSSISWVLKGLGETPNRVLCILFFLTTAILSILTALSFRDLLISHNAVQGLALATALLSSFSLILFPRALAMFFNLAGALLVNVFLYWYVITDPDL